MSQKWSNVTICVPSFNEEGTIASTLASLVDYFPGAEVICVNDGSTDSTLEKAQSVKGVKVIDHGRNIGYGASLKTAMRAATGDVIAWFDADGQHRASDLEKVLNSVFSHEYDAAIGVRDKNSSAPIRRRPGKFIIHWAARMVVGGREIPDLNSGMRAFQRSVIRKYAHLLPDGFSATTTTTLLLMKRSYRIGYVPITASKRQGTSSVKIFQDGFRTLHLTLKIFILFNAFRFFTALALLQIIPGVAYGGYIAVKQGLGLPASATTLIISGMLTFFMGIVTDQIVELRKEKFEHYS